MTLSRAHLQMIADTLRRTALAVGEEHPVHLDVAAALLVRQGYDCVGVTMKLFEDGADLPDRPCCSLDATSDARRVAERLGIPHYVLNMVDHFGRDVIADFVADRPGVTRVWYPTRHDHPQRDLAMRQMTAGGTVVTFEVAGGKDAAFRVMNAFELIRVSNNLGDSKSLATHPATTTHMRIGEEERARLGITDGVIRVSIGLEDTEDLMDDLARALAAGRG